MACCVEASASGDEYSTLALLLHLRAQRLLGTELVHEMRRLSVLLLLPSDLELHVEAGEDLDGRLTDAAECDGKLGLDE